MGLLKVIGAQGQLEQGMFSPAQAGYGMCLLHDEGPLICGEEEVWATKASYVNGNLEGTVRIEFEFLNSMLDMQGASMARLYKNGILLKEEQASIFEVTLSVDTPIKPGDNISLDLWSVGYGSETIARNVRFCVAPPVVLLSKQ